MSDTADESPYASPRPVEEPQTPASQRLSVADLRRGLLTVLLSALLFAVIGMLLGMVIGTLFPGYYYTVFPLGAQQADFDPFSVGVGLGLSQGFGGGAVIGLIVVVATAWSRHHRPQS
jgi:hypothetical protein